MTYRHTEELRWTYRSQNGLDMECWVCLIRSKRTWRTGYVRVPPGISDSFDADTIRVHGGVTFHKDEVIGFDTMHADDRIENWPIEAMVKETESMAEQVSKHVSGILNLLHTVED